MKKQTHTQQVKQQAQTLKQQVCSLLGWDETQFAEFQYKTGCNYLQHYIPNDPQGIDMLLASKLFWNWFKNHWARRDADFIAQAIGKDADAAMEIYHSNNDARNLAAAIYPSGVVLNETYAKLIGQIIDKQTSELCR